MSYLGDGSHNKIDSLILIQTACINEMCCMFTSNLVKCYTSNCWLQDPRFNRDVDKSTGYQTKNILCMPVKAPNGQVVTSFAIAKPGKP